MKIFYSTILVLFATLNLNAQSVRSDSLIFNLDSVVVKSARYTQPVTSAPFSIYLARPDEGLKTGDGLSTKSILSTIPGVIVNDRSNLSQGDRILIRGIGTRAQFGVRGIKILLDGIPLTFPDGQSQLNNLDIHQLRKVEVISGPGSVLYGNSSGGIIDFSSRTNNKENIIINPKYYYGSYNLNKLSIGSSGKISETSFDISLNRLSYKGFREHSNAESYSGNLILSNNITGNLRLTGIVNYYNAPYLLNPSSLTKGDAINNPEKARDFIKSQVAGKDVEQFQSGLNIEYNLSADEQIDVVVYGVSRTLLNSIPGRIIELDRIAGGIRSQFSTRQTLFENNLNILTGIDYDFMIDDRSEFENLGRSIEELKNYSPSEYIDKFNYGDELLNQQERVNGVGAFVKTDYQLMQPLTISIGGRYDLYKFSVKDKYFTDGEDNTADRDMSNFSSMAGIIYRPGLSTSIYINYSNAFQTPTTNELSNTPDNSGGFNRSLEPEIINSFEAGIRGLLFSTSFYNITVFTMTLNNMLIPYQVESTESEEIYYKNAGESSNNGIEVSLESKPSKQTDLKVSFTYMDFKFADYKIEEEVSEITQIYQLKGKSVPGVPKFNLSTYLTYSLSDNLKTSTDIYYSSKVYTNDFNGPPPGVSDEDDNYINDSYFTVGLRLGYTFSFEDTSIKLIGGINNVFDERYNGSIIPNAFGNRFFEPSPGRNYFASFSIQF